MRGNANNHMQKCKVFTEYLGFFNLKVILYSTKLAENLLGIILFN